MPIRFPDALGAGVDAWAWVADDLGNGVGGTFRCSAPCTDNSATFPLLYVPVPGVAVETCSLPSVSMSLIEHGDFQTFLPGDFGPRMEITRLHFSSDATTFVAAGMYTALSVGACFIADMRTSGSGLYIYSCYTSFGYWLGGDTLFEAGVLGSGTFIKANPELYDGVILDASVTNSTWTFIDSNCIVNGGLGYFPCATNNRRLTLNGGQMTVSGNLFGISHNGAGVNHPYLTNGARMFIANPATQILYPPNPAADPAVRISGVDFLVARLPYADGSGAGVLPATTGNAYSRPVEVGIKGAIAAGDTYPLLDLTGSGTDILPIVVTSTGTLKNLRAYIGTPGAGVTTTITVLLNGAPTAVTCATAAGGGTANDSTHSVVLVAGDRISFKCTASGVNGSDLSISAEIV